ncbi:sugar phosphate isomerase [Blastococcus sp. MG754426]|uniref:sugar phosphate isomerase/epimerase family protein n=1 Tax=unclassified Blastococcus TaxID=2619396 RepID=UPI001EF11B90|nr:MULTISPECIES: sugar phosphate isomerase/epimerase [unclassified Blastococcus]MCF6507219.1 sugar phosphate isomerase [Blastococcus sp. MG754426]MCF6511929.1 sugar phosphate isomerase [Blastococcus sp. MG754427]
MSAIRWAYAINQWKPQFDDFVRREEHERALKTISIAGFEGVELTYGTGRWEPLGNPQQLAANFGSVAGFREFLRSCALDGVSSWYWDPAERSMEHLTGPLSPLAEADVPAIVDRARELATALAELGGSVLLVRPVPGAGDVEPLDDDAIGRVAACWDAVGRATAEHGVRLALHVDFLSALRRDHAPRLIDRTDPALVGLALDTGELTVGGIDPLAVIATHGDRIAHVQFKDALAVDDAQEYLQPHAHWTVRVRGGAREVPRWFAEPGANGGLVDFPAITRALLDAGYAGWIVVESDQSPHPAASALLAGYLVQQELGPMVHEQRKAAV